MLTDEPLFDGAIVLVFGIISGTGTLPEADADRDILLHFCCQSVVRLERFPSVTTALADP